MAKANGVETKPVLIGILTYLLLGKEKEAGFSRLDLADRLLPVYIEIIESLVKAGAKTIQIDEPYLVLDLPERAASIYRTTYEAIAAKFPNTEFILTTYFGGLGDNLNLALSLPLQVLHIDLVRAPQQLDLVLELLPPHKKLSLGLVDGRKRLEKTT